MLFIFFFFFFKQKTAYEITTGDWGSDVCSSDLVGGDQARLAQPLSAAASRRDEVLQPARQVLASVASGLQALGLAPQISAAPMPRPTAPQGPAGVGHRPAPMPDWKTFRLGLKTQGLPPQAVLGA